MKTYIEETCAETLVKHSCWGRYPPEVLEQSIRDNPPSEPTAPQPPTDCDQLKISRHEQADKGDDR